MRFCLQFLCFTFVSEMCPKFSILSKYCPQPSIPVILLCSLFKPICYQLFLPVKCLCISSNLLLSVPHCVFPIFQPSAPAALASYCWLQNGASWIARGGGGREWPGIREVQFFWPGSRGKGGYRSWCSHLHWKSFPWVGGGGSRVLLGECSI